MIDNVLNNEKPKEEKEKQSGRISIKEKQAEKKEVTRQRDKAEREVPEKGTEKKLEREIWAMDKFTVEEINFMCVFEGQDRQGMITEIKNIILRIQQ